MNKGTGIALILTLGLARAEEKPLARQTPEDAKPVTLWSGGEMPGSSDLARLAGTEFHVIKRQRPDVDG